MTGAPTLPLAPGDVCLDRQRVLRVQVVVLVRVCVPVTDEGTIDSRWGRAERVVVAEVHDGVIDDWREHVVRWDVLHDAGPEGAHHARVARFIRDEHVTMVLAERMGDGMARMLHKLGVSVHLGLTGEARVAMGVERS